jgi:hypothetical protein
MMPAPGLGMIEESHESRKGPRRGALTTLELLALMPGKHVLIQLCLTTRNVTGSAR